MKWLCKLIGHCWVTYWRSETKTFDALTCKRCGEPAWRS